MPNTQVTEFLKKNHVHYQSIKHSPAYTAQEIAHSAHIRGNELAKIVIIKLKDKLAMVVTTANTKINLTKLERALNSPKVELASELDFKDKFPGCEVGAMPPFGNLYNMDVYLDEKLTHDKEISFNGGTHSELLRMPYHEFEQAVHPKVIDLH